MEKITEDKLVGLVDIYSETGTGINTTTRAVNRSEIASYFFSTILKESNKIVETVNNIIDKINESEYYIKKPHLVNNDTIINDVVVKLKKDNMVINAGNIVCYCNPDTKELVNIRVFFSEENDPKDDIIELDTNNLFKNKEDCMEALLKKVKESINKKHEKQMDYDYSYFLRNNKIIL